MSLYGFSGFPLRDSLPRGSSFVYFMRGFNTTTRAPAPPALPATPSVDKSSASTVGRPVPGGFDDAATEVTLSRTYDTLADGTVHAGAEKLFSDGSRRSEMQYRRPDGSRTIKTERRSLPGEDGFQKVRIWERTTAPDGSQSGTFHMFRVPNGAQMDWNGAEAQQFLETSVIDGLNPDGSLMPDLAARPAEAAADTAEPIPPKDAPATRPRPVIPIMP